MGVLHTIGASFSINNIFYDRMDLTLSYFRVTKHHTPTYFFVFTRPYPEIFSEKVVRKN